MCIYIDVINVNIFALFYSFFNNKLANLRDFNRNNNDRFIKNYIKNINNIEYIKYKLNKFFVKRYKNIVKFVNAVFV